MKQVGFYYEVKIYTLTWRCIKTSWQTRLSETDPSKQPFAKSQIRNIQPVYLVGIGNVISD